MKLMSPRRTAVGQTLRVRREPHVADHDGLRSDVGGRVDLRLDEKKAGAFGGIHALFSRSRCSFVQEISAATWRFDFAMNPCSCECFLFVACAGLAGR